VANKIFIVKHIWELIKLPKSSCCPDPEASGFGIIPAPYNNEIPKQVRNDGIINV